MANFPILASGLVAAVFFGGFLGLALAYMAWQRREQRGATAFILYSLSYSAWMFAAGFLWLSPTRTVAIAFDLLTYLAGTAVLLAWVFFVITYTEQRDRFTGWRLHIVAGYAVAFSFQLSFIAVRWFTEASPGIDSYQGLTVVTAQPELEPQGYGIVMSLVGLSILFWTFYVLWQYARSEVSGQRQQARLILYTGMAPTVGYTAYVAAGLTLHEHLDPTPLLFTITVVGTWFALFAYDFLEIEPVAANRLFETMEDPVLIVDEENTVLTANESAQALPISSGQRLPRAITAAIESEKLEVRLDTANGDQRVFDLSVSSLGDGDRRLVVLRDVTIRNQRERELERQNERLDEFASVVSHDLRNPLSVAEGNLTLLEETGNLDRTDTIRESHERMETIIDDLLTMARSGQTIEETNPVDVHAVATEAFEQVPTAEVDITFEVDASATIEADRNKLLQVFENLFRNSVEHNDPPLSVSVHPVTDDDGASIGFAVEDTGSGIPPEQRDQIFDHGYTTSTDGSGFGLSIVENIVTAHDWTVTVTESESGGVRFEITGCHFPTDSSDDDIGTTTRSSSA